MRATGWLERFRRSSQSARVHQYFRYSLYSFSLMEMVLIAMIIGPGASGADAWARVSLAAAAGARAVLGLLLTRAGLRYYLGHGERPGRLFAAFTAATFAALALVYGAVGAGGLPDQAISLVIYLAGFYAGPVLLVLPARRAVAVAALPVVAAAAGFLAVELSARAQTWVLGATVLCAASMGLTCWASGWTLSVVDRLDRARETQARLAVAEERLRFGRDLHDVLGWNLSVIALKSELAVQLAQRDSAAAADQMTEVQRIARDSQREIREVVRGYRGADLRAELAGARGILQAAGIACGIEAGDGGALSPQVRSALGWVVREGATNVLRHAEAATSCTVRLRRTAEGEAVLDMENDGVRAGADPGGEGTGLAGLRERLAELGGSLRADPGAGGTFRLVARVPAEGGR
jgi:two-component system sensor histidine kinase DesK